MRPHQTAHPQHSAYAPLVRRAERSLPRRTRTRVAVGLFFCVAIAAFGQTPSPAADAQALYRKALQLEQSKDLAMAQRTLLQAHTLAPADVPIEIVLAKLDALLGRNDDAVALFRKVQADHPANAENALNLAIALAQAGPLDEALTYATLAAKLSPRSSAAHHLRGKILDDLGRPADAQAQYESALAISPTDPLLLYDFALLYESTGNPSEEVSLLRRLIKVRPNISNDHFLLGRALSHTGDQPGSRLEFREAVRIDPNNRAALYNLYRSLRQENPDEAEQFAARFRALKLSDDELNNLRDQGNRGVRAMQAQNWTLAISIFQAALTACSGCTVEATLEKDLGIAQCQSGDTLAGTASLRRALALNPSDLDVLKAIEVAERSAGAKK